MYRSESVSDPAGRSIRVITIQAYRFEQLMANAPPEEAGGDLLTATVERYDGGIDVCTIHPVDPDDTEETTAWVSAETGSFFAVDRLR